MKKLKFISIFLVLVLMLSLGMNMACGGNQQPCTHDTASIKVTTNPAKMTYYIGETFDQTGMVVKAHCSKCNIDYEVKDYTINYKTVGQKSFNEGDTYINIVREDKTCKLEGITVKQPTYYTVNYYNNDEILIGTEQVVENGTAKKIFGSRTGDVIKIAYYLDLDTGEYIDAISDVTSDREVIVLYETFSPKTFTVSELKSWGSDSIINKFEMVTEVVSSDISNCSHYIDSQHWISTDLKFDVNYEKIVFYVNTITADGTASNQTIISSYNGELVYIYQNLNAGWHKVVLTKAENGFNVTVDGKVPSGKYGSDFVPKNSYLYIDQGNTKAKTGSKCYISEVFVIAK